MRTHRRPGEQGFSLIELLMVLAIAGVMAAMSLMAFPTYTRYAQAEAGTAQVLDVLRSARDLAVTQRRNIDVSFIGSDTIQLARVEFPSGARTVLSTTRLEHRLQFLLPTGIRDTPDAFGNASATAFGTSPRRMFTSEGRFVDANGDVLNGTVFVSIPGDATSTRAITVFGATALLRTWRWNGAAWKE